MKILRLILGDQLNARHTWFQQVDDEITYLLMELEAEASYVVHHIQKVLGFFVAMREFAQFLRQQGHQVIYLRLDDQENQHSLANIPVLIEKLGCEKFEYLLPDEYRLDQQLLILCRDLNVPCKAYDSEHFITQRQELKDLFAGKRYLMESFYRTIRKKHNLLMEGDKPYGGRWNFDSENRGKWDNRFTIPNALLFPQEVSDIYQMVQNMRIKTIGQVDPKRFGWPTNRDQALQLLDHFVSYALPFFGRFQDAMTIQSRTLFHSRLSFALNIKLLHPLEVVQRAMAAWQADPLRIGLAQIEGFIRQIIGWREYLRGVYWAEMPRYATLNFFNSQRPLPHFYWDSETQMHCMHYAIRQSLEDAYAHHIQRLMVTGNFAALAGIHPDEVDRWYLGIYIDAIQWVEITNTRGMSQFADGGLVGTKPYTASANYIAKMSDYCDFCYYDKSKRYGDRACPFNSLYWHFLDRHRALLQNNPRIGMAYRTWDRFNADEKTKILEQANFYLHIIESL